MTLFDALAPPRYVPPRRRSRAKLRACVACGDRTMRATDLCAACAAAERRTKGPRLPVSCWCEDTTVWVMKAAIVDGLTRSCGLEHCTPELIAA